MYRLNKIIAALVVCLLLLSSALFAFGEDLEELANSGISEPAPENDSTGYAETEDTGQYTDVMDVILPYDISFDIVIAAMPYQGFVTSKDFKIMNVGDDDVAVRIFSAQLTFSDEVHFSISDTAELPEDGNNIFAELICISGNSKETLPLRNEPGDEEYIYYLESGSEGTFRIEGTVNEAGDVPWSDNHVAVSICYSIGNDGEEIVAFRENEASETEQAYAPEETAASDESDESDGSDIITEILPTEPVETPEAQESFESNAAAETEATSELENISESDEASETQAPIAEDAEADEFGGTDEPIETEKAPEDAQST